jgi:hypothetical protein
MLFSDDLPDRGSAPLGATTRPLEPTLPGRHTNVM